MGVYGADVEQLRSTAQQLSRAADRLQDSRTSLNQVVTNTRIWAGPDANRFRSQWNAESAPLIDRAARALRSGADTLRRNADEQEQASRAGTGAVSAGSPGAASSGSAKAAPAGTSGLYKTIRTLDDSYDGVRIQQVVGPDGKTRFIVYLAGTDLEDSKRDLLRNIKMALGQNDPETMAKIDRALRAAGYDPNDKSKQPEMMFVGFSQGGMEAQNLIASGRYNAQALVTYGSPLVHGDQKGVSTVHLRAEGDNTPNLAAEALAIARRDMLSLALLRTGLIKGPGSQTALLDPLAGASKNIYTADSHTSLNWNNPAEAVLTGNHGDAKVYTNVGADFDKASDPRFAAQKAQMAKFTGTVTRTWDGDPPPSKGS